MPKLSIIIATRNEPANLWFTLQGLQMQVAPWDDIEVVVADNEPGKVEAGVFCPTEKILRECRFPHWRWIDASQTKSPYSPRNLGASAAGGNWLLFLDSHVLLQPGFLKNVIESIYTGKASETSLMHYPVSFGGSDRFFGHYHLRLDGDFWGGWQALVHGSEPYKIAASGIWAFLIEKGYYLEVVEGFNPNFKGYSGGEPYLDLKVWMLGGSVWMDPRFYGLHYSGPRGYSASWDDRVRNFALAVSVISPEKIDTFSKAIAEKTKLSPMKIEGLVQQGIKLGEEESFRFRKRAQLSLNEVIGVWTREGIPA